MIQTKAWYMERRIYGSLRAVSFILCLGLYLLRLVSPLYAAEVKEPIIVNGDKVEYLYEKKRVRGIGNVSITYKDVVLTCDMIDVNMDTKDAVASGHVILTQGSGVFKGEKIYYNFEAEKGTVIESEIRWDPWYGKSKALVKPDDKKYTMENGYITTCDLPHPHYRVQARRIKIYVDSRVEAFHVLFFVGKVPVFYFPYYVHPLKDKRPRVTIIPGRNSRWGAYVLTAWRYYFHEWSRGYVHLDWRQKKGFAEGIDYKYKMGYFGKGLTRFYYTNEDHVITDEELEKEQSISDDRWRFQIRHKWDIDKDTVAVGEFHKLSDKLFIKDYYFGEEYESSEEPETYLSVIRTRPEYDLSLYFRVRTHDFFTVVEKLPELKMNIKNQRLRNTDFYYKSTTSYAMLQKKYEDTLFDPKLRANRFDTDHEISYLKKLFKFLTFNPYAGIRETWYSEDANGKTNEMRDIYTLGLKLSTKFYRVFSWQTDFLGLDINGVKHIFTPYLNYRYTPAPSIKPEDLKQFDAVDNQESYHGIGVDLVNRFQTKRGSEQSVVNIARFTTSTQLFIKPKYGKTLDDVKFDLDLWPYSWLTINSDSTYNPKENRLDTANIDVVAREADLWRIGLGFRFEDDGLDDWSSQVTADASYRLSAKWNLKTYYRFKKSATKDSFDLEEQDYVIERDLHCWIAELDYQIKSTEGLEVDKEYRVWLVMRLKAFPGLPIKMFNAAYSAPRAGVESESSY